MNQSQIKARVLPILDDYLGVAAEFVLDDILASVPSGQAFDQRVFLYGFERALRKELPAGVPADAIMKSIKAALSKP
jgi:hypothetical protein